MKSKNIKCKFDGITVELRDMEYYERISDETLAMAADVYIDGKYEGTLENSGCGEGYYPCVNWELRSKLEELLKPHSKTYTSPYDGTLHTLHYNVDFFFSDLVYAAYNGSKSFAM